MSDDPYLAGIEARTAEAATTLLDTPVHRATINKLAVVEFEALLDDLRERRLLARQKVEKAAKIKTEKADVSAYLKFQKQLAATKKLLDKLDAEHTKVEAAVHKLRVLTVEMGVEH